MARRNEKYTPEMREQIAAYILESEKSATKTAKEKEKEAELETQRKKLAEAQEDIEILISPCTSLCNPANEVRSDQEVPQGISRDKDVQGPSRSK